ncbi:MAG: DUF1460 domain-containing protein [Bacteroidales bacterium]|nr:DUF1460 domain-containing protein [Bacteroidales bacterium]
MMRNLILFTSLILMCLNINAITLDEIRFHNEEKDTTIISRILNDAYSANLQNPNERIGYIARMFLGKPYVAHTLECTPEQLSINIDELDCTTFVETVIAMAYTVGEGRTSWRDFVSNLEKIRYRDGNLDGYSSRLHYISDWIVNNSYRGNLQEVTSDFNCESYTIKTLDFMTTHRDSYKALSDENEYTKLKNHEIGYRRHRYPYIKTSTLKNKEIQNLLKDGDIIALTTKTPGLDVSHMGLIAIIEGVPHLMHASMKAMKVIIDPLPLHKYLNNSKSLTGIRIIRIKQ